MRSPQRSKCWMIPGPSIFTSVLSIASMPTPYMASVGRLQPVGGVTGPVIVCPFRRNLTWSAPKEIHGFAPGHGQLDSACDVARQCAVFEDGECGGDVTANLCGGGRASCAQQGSR